MKLLTKNTDYAVRALVVMSQNPGSFMSARDISKEQKIPYQYLRKILQKLIETGYAESREGAGGGFRIRRFPDDIKVSDVIKAFQGDIQFSECIFRKNICHNRKDCVLRKNVKRIESMVAKEFSGITIGTLLKGGKA